MTTTGYLILISALAIVAGIMVYTKFAFRIRERQEASEDQGPLNESVDFAPSVISAAEKEREIERLNALDDGEGEEESLEMIPLSASATGESTERESTEQGKPDTGEYYDDLQEAAAGLAMLMRSSQAAHHSPARFVVEPEESACRETEMESGQGERLSERSVLPETETMEIPVEPGREASAGIEDSNTTPDDHQELAAPEGEREAISEEALLSEEELTESDVLVAPEAENAEVRRCYLGEEVTGRIEQIDSGLDALEELVASIEASLASFTPLTEEIIDDELPLADEGEISHAA